MEIKSQFQDAVRIAVKVGTSTLTHENGTLNIRRIEALVRVLSDLLNENRQVVLVSSGAIGVGVGKLGLEKRPRDVRGKQACAAVGQCELMRIYDLLFGEYGHTVAQVLLTKDILEDAQRKQNVVNTFEELLSLGVIPVVNENDTVSTDEIEFGDNDTLSAVVARLVDADALIMMTDMDGLFDKNPREHKDAKLIPIVEHITEDTMRLASGTGSSRGTGGMATKLAAASIATQRGIPAAIINGGRPDGLYDLLEGKPVGTLFPVAK